MIKRGIQLILSVSLLFLAGCSGHETFHNNNDNNNNNDNDNNNDNNNVNNSNNNKDKRGEIAGGNRILENRFEMKPNGELIGKSEAKASYEGDYQYYRPAGDIERLSGKSSNTEIKIFRPSKSNATYFEKSTFENEPFLNIPGRISSEIFFTAVFDNDIFDYTDYYYTNGISLELYHPVISSSPICRILPGLKNSLNYYGLVLIQNMYTPRKLEELEVRAGDRPFAAYLTISHQRISLSSGSHRRLLSELALGAIGPASLGGIAQDMIHTNTPVGWVNQVKNDAVVNYNIRLDQGVYSGNGIEVAVIAGGQAGTLYDNIMGGLYLQIGKSNDRYGSLFSTTPHQKTFIERIRYYFSIDAKTKLVMYDATLQGGMFNRESVYSLNAGQVKHCVFTGTASFGLGLGRYSLEAEQVFLTPEFDGGRHHLWFRIKNIFYLN